MTWSGAWGFWNWISHLFIGRWRYILYFLLLFTALGLKKASWKHVAEKDALIFFFLHSTLFTFLVSQHWGCIQAGTKVFYVPFRHGQRLENCHFKRLPNYRMTTWSSASLKNVTSSVEAERFVGGGSSGRKQGFLLSLNNWNGRLYWTPCVSSFLLSRLLITVLSSDVTDS